MFDRILKPLSVIVSKPKAIGHISEQNLPDSISSSVTEDDIQYAFDFHNSLCRLGDKSIDTISYAIKDQFQNDFGPMKEYTETIVLLDQERIHYKNLTVLEYTLEPIKEGDAQSSIIISTSISSNTLQCPSSLPDMTVLFASLFHGDIVNRSGMKITLLVEIYDEEEQRMKGLDKWIQTSLSSVSNPVFSLYTFGSLYTFSTLDGFTLLSRGDNGFDTHMDIISVLEKYLRITSVSRESSVYTLLRSYMPSILFNSLSDFLDTHFMHVFYQDVSIHTSFLEQHIPAVTLIPHAHVNSVHDIVNAHDQTKTLLDNYQQILLTVSHLHERLHHSSTSYFLLSPSQYITSADFSLPTCCILVALSLLLFIHPLNQVSLLPAIYMYLPAILFAVTCYTILKCLIELYLNDVLSSVALLFMSYLPCYLFWYITRQLYIPSIIENFGYSKETVQLSFLKCTLFTFLVASIYLSLTHIYTLFFIPLFLFITIFSLLYTNNQTYRMCLLLLFCLQLASLPLFTFYPSFADSYVYLLLDSSSHSFYIFEYIYFLILPIHVALHYIDDYQPKENNSESTTKQKQD
ncbi:hypothetical protein WA158_002005 [Blastocystis sp. Blastoise]